MQGIPGASRGHLQTAKSAPDKDSQPQEVWVRKGLVSSWRSTHWCKQIIVKEWFFLYLYNNFIEGTAYCCQICTIGKEFLLSKVDMCLARAGRACGTRLPRGRFTWEACSYTHTPPAPNSVAHAPRLCKDYSSITRIHKWGMIRMICIFSTSTNNDFYELF